jgi:dipeptidase E
MKLYLSSYRLGYKSEELLKLLDGKKKVGVIFNAYDSNNDAARAASLEREYSELRQLGLEAEEVDLRQYFGDNANLASRLALFDLIWVRGGNVFILRKALKQSGADVILSNLITSNKVVYGGYSAGVCVLAPDLHGIELVDDEHLTPEKYSEETIWEALHILPYAVAPHYKSDHPESEAINLTIQYFTDNHIPFVALRDGEAIVVDENGQRIVGSELSQ